MVDLIFSVPAALVCLSAVYTFFLLVVSSGVLKRPSARFLSHWAVSFWAPALGGTLIILRPLLPLWISEYVACMLFVCGLGCVWLGMRCFWHRRPSYGPLLLAVFGIVPLGLVFDSSVASMALSRQLYIFGWAAVFHGLAAMEITRGAKGQELAFSGTTCLTFVSFSILHVAAMPLAVVYPIDLTQTVPRSVWLFGLVVLSMLHTVAAAFMCLVLARERAEAEVRRMANTDLLTGLRNRRSFVREAETFLKTGADGTLLILDLDRFKQINDVHGHAAGDMVLRVFAEFLSAFSSGSVVAGRLGGEEFGVLVMGKTGERLDQLARQICVGTSLLKVELPAAEVCFTVSIGLTDTGVSGRQFDQLFEDADSALYEAKRQGRNRSCRYRRPQPARIIPLPASPGGKARIPA